MSAIYPELVKRFKELWEEYRAWEKSQTGPYIKGMTGRQAQMYIELLAMVGADEHSNDYAMHELLKGYLVGAENQLALESIFDRVYDSYRKYKKFTIKPTHPKPPIDKNKNDDIIKTETKENDMKLGQNACQGFVEILENHKTAYEKNVKIAPAFKNTLALGVVDSLRYFASVDAISSADAVKQIKEIIRSTNVDNQDELIRFVKELFEIEKRERGNTLR